ncbi:MAG: pacearchaeosortase [Anaerohalosphaera sp.]|nr:pacearchaeosortase [Anaerohalosphaera sp.]
MGRINAITGLAIRYLIVILVSVFGFWIFEFLLTPPTITVLTNILKLFYDKIVVIGPYLYVNGKIAEVASNCIMGPVYWLLFVLIFATAGIKPIKRALTLLVLWTTMFALNIVRMVFMVSIIHEPYFNIVHWLIENFFSGLLFVIIWILTARLIKIETIPFYSDYKFLQSYFKG